MKIFSFELLTDENGVVGLDFLKEHKFCIDIKKREVSIDI